MNHVIVALFTWRIKCQCGFMVLFIADGISQFKDFVSGYCVIFPDSSSLSECFDVFYGVLMLATEGVSHFGDSVFHVFLVIWMTCFFTYFFIFFKMKLYFFF